MTEQWKPWYERMADEDSPQARDDYVRNVWGGPNPDNFSKADFAVGAGLGALAAHFIFNAIFGRRR